MSGTTEIAQVEQWPLEPSEEERQSDVATVTAYAPKGKCAVFVLLECTDGKGVCGTHVWNARRAQRFGARDAAELARQRALRRLQSVRESDLAKAQAGHRRAQQGEPVRFGARHGERGGR